MTQNYDIKYGTFRLFQIVTWGSKKSVGLDTKLELKLCQDLDKALP